MSRPVRLGGRVALPGGTDVVWSVAEGARGRRWREATTRDGVFSRSLLLEVSDAGRPARLEMTTAAGLLTLHPAGEAELHGNVVGADGVRHLRFDWGPDHELFVVESPGAAAIAIGHLARGTAVGERRHIPSLAIDDRLVPVETAWEITRIGPTDWHLSRIGEHDERQMRLDDEGIAVIPGLVAWPLELD